MVIIHINCHSYQNQHLKCINTNSKVSVFVKLMQSYKYTGTLHYACLFLDWRNQILTAAKN